MTLEARVFGRARLEDGQLTVRILTKDGWRTAFSAEPAPGRWYKGRTFEWAEIDRQLRRYGYERSTPASDGGPEDGVEFAVAGWSRDPARMRHAPPDVESRTVALELPPAEVAETRRSLDGLQSVLDDWTRDAVDALTTGLDEADPTTLVLTASHAGSLWSLLSASHRYEQEVDADSVRTLENLARHLERCRPVAGPWPHVRDTLRTALHEALTRPGAEGLAARDELLDMVRGFADAHRTATAADDEEQRRLQAERAEPEQPGPAR